LFIISKPLANLTQPVQRLRWIVQKEVFNEDTKFVIKEVWVRSGHSPSSRPVLGTPTGPVRFSMEKDEGKAILG